MIKFAFPSIETLQSFHCKFDCKFCFSPHVTSCQLADASIPKLRSFVPRILEKGKSWFALRNLWGFSIQYIYIISYIYIIYTLYISYHIYILYHTHIYMYIVHIYIYLSLSLFLDTFRPFRCFFVWDPLEIGGQAACVAVARPVSPRACGMVWNSPEGKKVLRTCGWMSWMA
jgi:hypothetical protein